MKKFLLVVYVLLVAGSIVLEIVLCSGLKRNGIEMSEFSEELVVLSRATDEYFESTDDDLGLEVKTEFAKPTKNKKGAYNYVCVYTITPKEGNTFESGIVNLSIICTDKNGEEKLVTKDFDLMKNKRSGSFKLGVDFIYEQKFKVEVHVTSGRYLHKYNYIYHIDGGNNKLCDSYYVNSNGLKFFFDNSLSYDDGLKIGRNRFSLGASANSDVLYIPETLADRYGYVLEEYNPMELLIGNPSNFKKVTTLIIDADVDLSDLVRSTMMEKFTNLREVYIRSVNGTSKAAAKELGVKEKTFTKNLKKGKYTHLSGYDVSVIVGSTNCKALVENYFKSDASFGSLIVGDPGFEITDAIRNNEKRY